MSSTMARLNESAVAPSESIESLKRKFMRQNRDIARANSAQSLRIRNLENETSRLLTENLGLREQILQLRNELKTGKAQRIADNTAVIKAQLEAKLLEIGAFIGNLGEEAVLITKSPREDKTARGTFTKSPDQHNWKNICTLSEAVAGQEGRLPPILENKSYPRRTLEPQEFPESFIQVAVDTTDSPDIGPPPISQFVDEDPVKINLPTRLKKNEHEELSPLDPTLSMSIEQRRKRRDSSACLDSRRPGNIEGGQVHKENTVFIKTGAKRKLSVRDDNEQNLDAKSSGNPGDDFKFTRVATEEKSKTMPQMERSGSKVARELAIARGAPREKQSASAAPSSRKVLAPKSVNNSPKKNSRPRTHEEMKVIKRDFPDSNPENDRPYEKTKDPASVKPIEGEIPLETIEVLPEPETPLALDLFSPSSSQPSTARNDSRDTPPPPDMGSGVDGQRPSRRARPAVSYAEPNLRDKMRRPTKELVDAVISGTASLRNSVTKTEILDFESSIKIKMEHPTDDTWKRMTLGTSATVENSPLSGKTSAPELLPSGITTYIQRRESLIAQNDTTRTDPVAAAAALAAGKRGIKAEGQERLLEQRDGPPKSFTTHDIYDFTGSSPVSTKEGGINPTNEEKQVSRYARRRSSVARDKPSIYDSESSDPEGSKKSDLSNPRRRQSTLGLRTTSAGSNLSKEEEAEKVLKRANSTIGTSDSGSIGARSDRVSARRRSMML